MHVRPCFVRPLLCAFVLGACSDDPVQPNATGTGADGAVSGGGAGDGLRDGGAPPVGAGRGGGGRSGDGAGRSGSGGSNGSNASRDGGSGDGGGAGSSGQAGADAGPKPPACPGCFEWVYVPFRLTGVNGAIGSAPDVADVDGDGSLDLIAPLQTGGRPNVIFWRAPSATGQDGWEPNAIGEHGTSSDRVEVAAGDLDGDGDNDVISTVQYSIVWWENLDGFAFEQHVIAWPGGEGSPLAGIGTPRLGDLDGDGDLDLATISYVSNRVLVWENRLDEADESAPWPRHDVGQVPYPYDLDVADADHDGDLDLLVASLESDSVTLYSNADGRGQIWTELDPVRMFDYATAGRAADIDGDGTLDVLASGAEGIVYSRRVGDAQAATYETHVIFDEDDVFDAAPVDMDDDGDLDVVALESYERRVSWWENDGSGGGWTKHPIATSFTATMRMRVLDVDGDGDSDLLLRSTLFEHLLLERRGCEGSCEAAACVEGERRCLVPAHANGTLTAVLTCQDGLWVPDACSNPNEVCHEQGDNGGAACIMLMCEPHMPGCVSTGRQRATCNALGNGWEDVQDCPADVYCLEGVCEPSTCTTSGPSTCSADGSGYEYCDGAHLRFAACETGKRCRQQGMQGICQRPFCAPGQVVCHGDDVVRCDATGATVSAPLARCAEDNQICHAGACAAAADVEIVGAYGETRGYRASSNNAGIRGNYYVMSAGRLLQEISLELTVTDRRTLRWVVYEGTGVTGLTKVHEHTTTTLTPGVVRVSSGPLSVPLQPGKSYLIGVHVDAPFSYVGFYAGLRAFTLAEPLSFATVQAVGVVNAALPPATTSVTLISGTGSDKPAYAQRLRLAPLP